MSTTPAERGLRTFLDHLRIERGVSPHTAAAYGRDLERWISFLAGEGIDDLAAVRPEHVAAFTRTLTDGDGERPGLAPSSVARALAAVRSLSRFAVEEGLATVNAAAEASTPKLPETLPKALSVHDVGLLLDSCDRDTVVGLRDAALLELLYGTGGRVSEIVDLDVDDLAGALADPDVGLRLFGKGRKERVVPLGSYARAAVDAWLVRGRPAWAAQAKRPSPALLLNTRGDRLSRQSAWQVIRAAAGRAGIKAEISPHTLRHSFATHLLDGGADVRVVQELLGHASVTTTQIYTKVTIDQLREVYLSSHPRSG